MLAQMIMYLLFITEQMLITVQSGELGEEEEVLNDRLDTKFHVFAEMGGLSLRDTLSRLEG